MARDGYACREVLAEQNYILDREIPYEEIVDPAPFHYAKEKLGL